MVATVATFALMTLVLDVAPVQREILEAARRCSRSAVLFYVSFWLISRLDHRRWMEFVNAKVWAAATTGATLALAGVGFTAVYREGFETALHVPGAVQHDRGPHRLGGAWGRGRGAAR